MFNIIIPGQPRTKKNSQVPITLPNGKPTIVNGKIFAKYERACLKHLKDWLLFATREERRLLPVSEPCHVRALYYLKDRRSEPDINNLQAATADILQKAGIISNDKLIEHWDGSRRVFGTPNPRVDIFIMGLGSGHAELFGGEE